MKYPDFFDEAPVIHTHDGLAELLGACEDGLMDYRYVDAVRVCGHSCPTVASAWLMARAALAALYPDGPAERGGVAVVMSAPEDEGTTGVVAQVLTLVTGAAGRNGFPGIGGRHVRRGLLTYSSGSVGGGAACLSRLDTGQCVAVRAELASVPPDPAMRPLFMQILSGEADVVSRKQFGVLWQERVRRLLTAHADDPDVVRIDWLEAA